MDQISVRAFDTVNNALRINATLASGGTHTPTDADQVFTSVFDSVNNAMRVNCVLGCGGTVNFAGDLGGTSGNQTVIGLQGRPVSTATPASNQVLAWMNGAWTPQTPTSGAGAGNCSSNQFVTAVNLGAGPNCIQPTFGNLGGAVSAGQLPPTVVLSSQPNTFSSKQILAPSTSTAASLNLPTGVAPTAPSGGDLWNQSGTLQFNDGTTTQSLLYQSRKITTTGALAGGGSLGGDLTLSVQNASSGAAGVLQLTGDLGGSATAPQVRNLQGTALSIPGTPSSGQVLTWVSGAWSAATPTSGGAQIAQDLGGSVLSPKVVGIQGAAVSALPSSNNQFLGWNGSQWTPVQPNFTNVNGAAIKSQQVSTTVYTDQPNLFGAGNKQTFTGTNSSAGVSLAPLTSDPTTLSPGDVWTIGSQLKWRDNSGTPVTRTVVDGTRNINTGGALTGGGSLGGDLTLSVSSATSGGAGVVQLSGDLGGTATSPLVAKLQGTPVTSTPPGANQFLSWSGGQWQPLQPSLGNLTGAVADNQIVSSYSGIGNCTTSGTFVTGLGRNTAPTCAPPAFSNLSGQALSNQLPAANSAAQGALQLTGDLGGTAASPLVAKLQGTPLAAAAPSNGQCLTFSATGSAWTPGSCASGSLGGAGTANLLPLWTGGATQGNSSLSQSGNDITVGAGLPSANFFIKGPTPFIDVTTYGAKPDAQTTIKACSVKPAAPGLGTLVCTRGYFAATDVGKAIQIPESGASQSAPLPVAASAQYTITNVAGVPSAGLYPQAVLSAAIAQANGTGGTGASEQVSWGTDNSAAFQAAWNAAPCRGAEVFVPGGGDYLFGSTVQTGVPAPPAPAVTAGSGGAGTIGASLYVTTAYTYVNRCGETTAAKVAVTQVGTGTNNLITFNGPAPAGANNATSYNLYACKSATVGACTGLTLQQSGIALNTLPATLNTVTTTGAAAPGELTFQLAQFLGGRS